MKIRKSFQISGDINAAVCDKIKNILVKNGIEVDIQSIPLSKSAPFGMIASIISLAAAIAGIISCVVTILQFKEQRKSRSKQIYENEVDNALQKIGDGTYKRIGDIKTVGNMKIESANLFHIILHDVPANRYIGVTVHKLETIIITNLDEIFEEKENKE